ncbi:hypothetical protein PP914_gp090 [Arthrobacter phage Qui]|uniref:Uncharacterized protein n=1 Tax=Arthrobacter phage Qui TaxID=2603260 RepID=A0A5B8WFK9_9CAUD|nr:hypothetical protein PP914_gp090 [Arthrobacter phage Qui]QED11580.1 hypothetical protein SEA_QUI_90 [Arthrobacter phage Qui]QOC56412.1 hypothetical protein SEA_PAELLA_90 [Arthrobacter phage Paella]
MNDDDAIVIVAALVKRLGGTVSLTRHEILAAMDLNLYRSDDLTSFYYDIKFSVEDNTIIQGVLV